MDHDKAVSNIDLTRSIYKSNIESLVSILKENKELIGTKISELDSQIEEWSRKNIGLSPNEIEPLKLSIFDDYNHYKHHFDYLLLHAVYISAFSLFEIHFRRVAEVFQESCNCNIKIGDIRANGELDTIRKYLHLVAGIKSASSDYTNWQELIHFKAIRNAIVHRGCILNHQKKENLNRVKGYKKIQQHKIWHSSDVIYFRIKKVAFLEDFGLTTISYSEMICRELIEIIRSS